MFVVVKISNCGAIMRRKIAAQKCGSELRHRIVAQKLRLRNTAQKGGGTEMRRHRNAAQNFSAELQCRIAVQNCGAQLFGICGIYVIYVIYR